ncbi:MAG: hypothetical protein ACP5PJ_09535 [Acidimicrobiales bacterium]
MVERFQVNETAGPDPARRRAFGVIVLVFALGLIVTSLIFLSAGWHERTATEPLIGGVDRVGTITSAKLIATTAPPTFTSTVTYVVDGRRYHVTSLPTRVRPVLGAQVIVSYNPAAPQYGRDLSQPKRSWGSLVEVGVVALAAGTICVAFGLRQFRLSRSMP